MKKFFKLMSKDIEDEHFTKKELVVYGVILSLVLVAIMGIAGWIETQVE